MVKAVKGNLVEQAYQAVTKKIITLELEPGRPLDEKGLMAELGIGRTPLREAIIQLKKDGFVEGRPNAPPCVKDLTLGGVKALFESLIIVEKNVTYLAAKRATAEQVAAIEAGRRAIDSAIETKDWWEMTSRNLLFHSAIAEASQNQYLTRFHQNLRRQAERLSYIAVSREAPGGGLAQDEHYRRISEHHGELVRCLREHDELRAEAVAVEHIALFQERILNYLRDISYL